jgi:NADPH:quinone reductase-like Zn-dependent oxidoreductase
MRAYTVDEFGIAGSVTDQPAPTPGPDEILVQIDTAALAERGVEGAMVNRGDPAGLGEIARLYDVGVFSPPSMRRFDLEHAGEALAESGGRHVRGKLVITLG